MSKRLLRISCFAAGVPLHKQCEKHFAPRSEERSHFIFNRERRKIASGKYGKVVLHYGNLKRNSYEIVQTADSWNESDILAVTHTAFDCFQSLLDAKGGFFPSLDVSHPERWKLADLYDEAQAKRNDRRRAMRWEREVSNL